jgi:hypothetical protein
MVAIRALSTLEEDLVHIYELRKLAAILVLVLGFFLGVLTTTICCAIFPPSPPSPARPQQKVTATSSFSSSPANKKVSKKQN